jgi:predicted PolB exonuclease-like 3'-5' exonuclease
MARLLGFPGKLGMDGGQVWSAYQRGELASIRAYCETDAANTFLVFLRFQLMRGLLTPEQYDLELAIVHESLTRSTASHWQEFIDAWQRPARPDPLAL